LPISPSRFTIYPDLRDIYRGSLRLLRGHINAISIVGEGLEESLVTVLQEIDPVPNSARIEGRKARRV